MKWSEAIAHAGDQKVRHDRSDPVTVVELREQLLAIGPFMTYEEAMSRIRYPYPCGDGCCGAPIDESDQWVIPALAGTKIMLDDEVEPAEVVAWWCGWDFQTSSSDSLSGHGPIFSPGVLR